LTFKGLNVQKPQVSCRLKGNDDQEKGRKLFWGKSASQRPEKILATRMKKAVPYVGPPEWLIRPWA